MSKFLAGELHLNKRIYVVVPSEEYDVSGIELFRKALGIPSVDKLWVGYLIRQHRLRLDLTQAELGSRTGSDQKHIDKIENGTIKRPKDVLLRKLVLVLGEDFSSGLSLLGITVGAAETNTAD